MSTQTAQATAALAVNGSPSSRTRSKKKIAQAYADGPWANTRSKKKENPTPENDERECPIYYLPIPPNSDYLRCARPCAAYYHRACFEEWSGRRCTCKGLLCNAHPDGRGVPLEYRRTRCGQCRGQAYPGLQMTEKRWRAVFDSDWFQRYIRHYHRVRYHEDPRSFNPEYMLFTPDEHMGGRGPVVFYDRCRASGDSVTITKRKTCNEYRRRRTQVTGANGQPLPPRLVSYLRRDVYKDLLTTFYGTASYVIGDQPPYQGPYNFDRLVYWYRRRIARGAPRYHLGARYRGPFAANVYLRNCYYCPINDMIHTRNSAPWARFRRMFERPEAEWGASLEIQRLIDH